MNAKRRAVAALYRELLADRVTPQQIATGVTPNYHVYAGICSVDRDALVAELDRQAIQTNVYYPMPLTRQAGYRGPAFAVPHACATCQQIIALPMYPEINESVVRTVASAVNGFATARN